MHKEKKLFLHSRYHTLTQTNYDIHPSATANDCFAVPPEGGSITPW